jgi:hypothetical protein
MTYLEPLARRIKVIASEDATFPEDTNLLFHMYALLARAKGTDVSLRDVHDAWVIWMMTQGEQHPSMVPFDELDEATQGEDQPFVDAIRQAAQEQQGTP